MRLPSCADGASTRDGWGFLAVHFFRFPDDPVPTYDEAMAIDVTADYAHTTSLVAVAALTAGPTVDMALTAPGVLLGSISFGITPETEIAGVTTIPASISAGVSVTALLTGMFDILDWIESLPTTELIDFTANQAGVVPPAITPTITRQGSCLLVERATNSIPLNGIAYFGSALYLYQLLRHIQQRAEHDPVFRQAIITAGGGALL